MRPENQLGNALATKGWDQAVRERAMQLDGKLDAYDFFCADKWNLYHYPDPEVDKPSSLYDQLKWLEAAGFKDVDVFWMRAGHAIFGGCRAAI
jgi:tRNA (cmo5U34)-methyltransferase